MTASVIASTLPEWIIPDPVWRENYVTPCCEQLIGAAYCLYKAEETGFGTADTTGYDVKGLPACIPQFAAGRVPEHHWWPAWLAGFYFNSALHRIVWACDRLLAIFGWLPIQGETTRPKKPHNIQDIKLNATTRLNTPMLRSQLGNVAGIRKALECLDDQGIPYVRVCERNFLSMLRWRVNVQKHALMGIAFPDMYVNDKGTVDGWRGSLTAGEQLQWVVLGLRVVSGVYTDVHHLYFKAQLLSPPGDDDT